MASSPPPAVRDPARLATLRESELLDSLPEEAFDRLTRLAARVLGVPTTLLSLVENDRQFFKSQVGLPEPWAQWRETPLSHSFCQYVVGTGEPLVVEDARLDPVLHDNEAIADLSAVAYAGVPLTTPEGHVLGSFCAIDDHARAWAPEDLEALGDLAAMAMTEINLRSSLRNHRLLTENASDMISTHSLAGVYRYASPAARTLLGREPESLVGRFAYDLIHPDDQAAVQEGHAAALADESRTSTTRYRLRRADGTYVWVETSGQVAPGGAGGHEVVAVTRDVSAQKAAEDALAAEREQLETLTEAIPQLVWTALPDGALDYVSGRVATFLGRSREAVLGAGWKDAVHPDDAPQAFARWAHALATGEPYEVEFRLRDADGAYHWHLGRALPLRDEAGAIVRWFGTNTDITDRKGLEAALETERARLESLLDELHQTQLQLLQQEKMASLGRVTAGIAHEIKNPLNFVVNFSEFVVTLADDLRDAAPGLSPEAGKLLDDLAANAGRVRRHGHRADRIARSMLELARDSTPVLVPTDVNALVAEHLALACDEDPARADGVAVETAFSPAVGEIAIDADAVGRVVINLVTNALDSLVERAQAGGAFTPRLSVATQRAGTGVAVVVRDNGVGIAPAVVPHIYEPFFTTKPPGQGTGLGLALAYETVVQTHGGQLAVETEVGQGATFTATLPDGAPG
ncbi:PAS domain-containing protein [Rubrivirga sp. IMCC45206]|uniref:PAS domain-containing protein n=1 Tax=Rubrivirga sp. IMCC45206 TaxID=3391614 RepID=UPI00398FD572